MLKKNNITKIVVGITITLSMATALLLKGLSNIPKGEVEDVVEIAELVTPTPTLVPIIKKVYVPIPTITPTVVLQQVNQPVTHTYPTLVPMPTFAPWPTYTPQVTPTPYLTPTLRPKPTKVPYTIADADCRSQADTLLGDGGELGSNIAGSFYSFCMGSYEYNVASPY